MKGEDAAGGPSECARRSLPAKKTEGHSPWPSDTYLAAVCLLTKGEDVVIDTGGRPALPPR